MRAVVTIIAAVAYGDMSRRIHKIMVAEVKIPRQIPVRSPPSIPRRNEIFLNIEYVGC